MGVRELLGDKLDRTTFLGLLARVVSAESLVRRFGAAGPGKRPVP